MNFEHGNGNKCFEVNDSDADSNTQGNDSPPSFSSSDSSQDFILDLNILNDKICSFKQDSPVPQGPNWTPEFAGQAPQSSSNTLMADHPKGYDPKRIPSAVFASRSPTPVEWSCASNESLFSIQLGNSSFSRDQVFMLYKSGELSKLDESIKLYKSGELSKLDESIKLAKRNDSIKLYKPDEPFIVGMPEQPPVHVNVQPSLPVVTEAENIDGKSEDEMEKDSEETHESAYSQKVVIVEIVEDHRQEKMPSIEDVHASCRSDESPNSTKSFAFPLLAGGLGGSSSVNMEVEREENVKENQPSTHKPQEQPSKQFEEPVQPPSPEAVPTRSAARRCFSCFCCFSHRR
ncbi:hypothetical protein ACOSQ3_028632 [Xanthoceras sorbifolium]